MELPLRIHFRAGFGGDTEESEPVLALEELTASYSGMCSFLKWFGVEGKCFLFILPKVFFNLVSGTKFVVVFSPQSLFFIYLSVSLDLPTFLSSQSPTCPGHWVPKYSIRRFSGWDEHMDL